MTDIADSIGTIRKGSVFVCNSRASADNFIASKQAAREIDQTWAAANGLDWRGETVYVIASGPSLAAEQCDAVRGKGRSIVINTSFRLAPWANVLYACDLRWWVSHINEVRGSFQGQLWSLDAEACRKFRIKHVQSRPSAGLCKQDGVIHQGRNSGYQAVNLAYHAGAKRIVLLGFDMKSRGGKKHWFGSHPAPMDQPLPYKSWIEAFDKMAVDLAAAGVEVLNATPGSALTCFPRVELAEL